MQFIIPSPTPRNKNTTLHGVLHGVYANVNLMVKWANLYNNHIINLAIYTKYTNIKDSRLYNV